MNILCTGATGFLGSHLIPLLEQDFTLYLTPRPQYDLRQGKHIDKLLIHSKPDIVIHLAADVGGLRYNLDNPASIYYNNVLMNTQLIHQSAIFGVKKFIFVSSVCAYPQYTILPTQEKHLWAGFPEVSNGSYGISKRIALTQLKAYKKQFGMDFSYPMLANLYGPNDRGFTSPHHAHLIANLVRKFCKHPETIEMYGEGKLTRDMLYVTDAARAITKFIDVDYNEPVNIATGTEVSVRDMVAIITEAIDFRGTVIWPDVPDKGELRRCYDISRAKEVLAWQPEVSIETGLRETIKWHEK